MDSVRLVKDVNLSLISSCFATRSKVHDTRHVIDLGNMIYMSCMSR